MKKLKCMMAKFKFVSPVDGFFIHLYSIYIQWMVPGSLGERGLAALPAVVWVQGKLTEMPRDVSPLHENTERN